MLYGFFQSCDGLLVVSVLIDFNVGASLKETGKVVKSFGFLVEHDDALHEVGVLVPVGCLQEVGCEHICL